MRVRWLLPTALCAFVATNLVPAARGDVRLPQVFGDHMVLQQEMPVPVWGWADPGEQVAVSVAGQSKTATADAQGKWSLKLDPLKAGGPHAFRVKGKNALEVADVLVGETWLCSGQSNMAMTVGGSANRDAELAAARFPQIRMLQVDRVTAETPQDDVKARWVVCSPETVGQFSATAYFFGRELHQQLKLPVGLINSSWGGTPIQAWTSIKAHRAVPELAKIVTALNAAIETYDPEQAKQRYEKLFEAHKKAVSQAKVEGKPFKGRPPRHPVHPRLSPSSAARLFNAMIAPLATYAIRGAIWYQGEANAGNAALYGLQLRTMIADWRGAWQEGDFPFLFVQLPNFMALQQKPSETSGWPLIREQFLKTLSVPNTGMAVTIDIGEADDIHPKNKQDVGRRLAWWALGKIYKLGLPSSGPLYRSAKKLGKGMLLDFECPCGGLESRDGQPLRGFAIAGKDHNFVWAQAKIQGEKLFVFNPDVPAPEAVRYLWANNPNPTGNLANQAGLPASPFRTDDWAD